MPTGNYRYLSWIIDIATSAIVAFLALPISFILWERSLEQISFDDLFNPATIAIASIFNGPAAVLGIAAARIIGRGKPADRRSAAIAGTTSLLCALMTDLSVLWFLSKMTFG